MAIALYLNYTIPVIIKSGCFLSHPNPTTTLYRDAYQCYKTTVIAPRPHATAMRVHKIITKKKREKTMTTHIPPLPPPRNIHPETYYSPTISSTV